MSEPEILTPEQVAELRRMVAERSAGHPAYQEQYRESLLPWQREQVASWAMQNLESRMAGYVPSLLATVEVQAEVIQRMLNGDHPQRGMTRLGIPPHWQSEAGEDPSKARVMPVHHRTVLWGDVVAPRSEP